MAEKLDPDFDPLIDEFRKDLEECEELYRSCAVECANGRPDLTGEARGNFLRRMIDLHRGLVLKIFVEVAYVDHHWTEEELLLAQELYDHVYRKRLDDNQIRTALHHFIDHGDLSWDALLGPFERLEEFRRRAADIQTICMRIANLVAKVDGVVSKQEVRQVKWIQAEIKRVTERIPVHDEDGSSEAIHAIAHDALKTQAFEIAPLHNHAEMRMKPIAAEDLAESKKTLEEGLAELDSLIGLGSVKQEVRGLINFLKIQNARKEFDLPQTQITLHTVFSGNPGTGKTTVARLLGQIFGAMGIISRGHLVETDRSGLVAEYAGQTAPKAHQKIDEALDGVLFIDEAYSLVAEGHEDPYGAEAMQVLLKRMEDNRDRLVIILAGYPEPLDRLLKSNPGLSSRFCRNLEFPDYTASELGCIFQSLCTKNRYVLPPLTRVKLLLGFQHLLEIRDERFGNGRLARNLFERAINRLANRIAAIVPMTRELLTTLQAGDIEFTDVPSDAFKALDAPDRPLHTHCPKCQHACRLAQKLLCEQVQCKNCAESFVAEWAEITVND